VNGAWSFLAIGLLLLGLVLFFLRRSRSSTHGHSESPQRDDLPAPFHAELFPHELADRLFGLEDWEFIAKQCPAQLRRMFLGQRTALALSLLHGVRENATRLIRVHSAAARTHSHLKPLAEVKVVADYVFIQMLCQVLALLIWLRGPVGLSRLVGHADNLSRRLHALAIKIFPEGLTAVESKRVL
jgi:hypothetical protein